MSEPADLDLRAWLERDFPALYAQVRQVETAQPAAFDRWYRSFAEHHDLSDAAATSAKRAFQIAAALTCVLAEMLREA